MILSRNFIDVKRLATSAINYITRSIWLLDYLKSIIKPLEYTVNQWVTESNLIKKYVKYSAQKGSLKVFVDDEIDIVEKRTYITENVEETLNLYSYCDIDMETGNITWIKEVDPNPTTLYGYNIFDGPSEFGYVWVHEDNPTPLTLYGYTVFQVFLALQDVDSVYIKDWFDEYIYTSEDDITINQYKWYLEGKNGEDIVFWIHSDIYSLMSDQDKQTLVAKLARYVPCPYTYRLEQFT